MIQARWLNDWRKAAVKPVLYHVHSRMLDWRFVLGMEEKEKFRTLMRMQENFTGSSAARSLCKRHSKARGNDLEKSEGWREKAERWRRGGKRNLMEGDVRFVPFSDDTQSVWEKSRHAAEQSYSVQAKRDRFLALAAPLVP